MPWAVSCLVTKPLRVLIELAHLEGPDIRLELVKGADHRFSDETCLALITEKVEEVLARA